MIQRFEMTTLSIAIEKSFDLAAVAVVAAVVVIVVIVDMTLLSLVPTLTTSLTWETTHHYRLYRLYQCRKHLKINLKKLLILIYFSKFVYFKNIYLIILAFVSFQNLLVSSDL